MGVTHETATKGNEVEAELDNRTKGKFVMAKGQVSTDPASMGVRRSTRERASSTRLKGFVQ